MLAALLDCLSCPDWFHLFLVIHPSPQYLECVFRSLCCQFIFVLCVQWSRPFLVFSDLCFIYPGPFLLLDFFILACSPHLTAPALPVKHLSPICWYAVILLKATTLNLTLVIHYK